MQLERVVATCTAHLLGWEGQDEQDQETQYIYSPPCTSGYGTFFKSLVIGAPGWRSRLSVRLQPGPHLAVREFEPRVGSGLMAQSLEPVSDPVSPSLSAPPPFMLCRSLSKK